jgi:hypothetical protein
VDHVAELVVRGARVDEVDVAGGDHLDRPALLRVLGRLGRLPEVRRRDAAAVVVVATGDQPDCE